MDQPRRGADVGAGPDDTHPDPAQVHGGPERVEHWAVSGGPVQLEEILLAAAVVEPDSSVARGTGDTLVLVPDDPGGTPLWLAMLGSDDGSVAHLEVVGPAPRARALVAELSGRPDLAVAVDDLGAGVQDDPAWLGRTDVGDDATLSVVEVPRPLLTLGPWLQQVYTDLEDVARPVVLRTPAATTASAAMRRVLRTQAAVWVREEDAGPVEGLSGTPLRWSEGNLVPDDRSPGRPDTDRAALRVQVAHPYDDARAVGMLSQQVLGHLGLTDSCRMGSTEPCTSQWSWQHLGTRGRTTSPEPSVTFLAAPGAAGTVSITPGPAVILEEIDLELAEPADLDALWAATCDLVPLMVSVTSLDGELTALIHPSALAAEQPEGEIVEDGYLRIARRADS